MIQHTPNPYPLAYKRVNIRKDPYQTLTGMLKGYVEYFLDI